MSFQVQARSVNSARARRCTPKSAATGHLWDIVVVIAQHSVGQVQLELLRSIAIAPSEKLTDSDVVNPINELYLYLDDSWLFQNDKILTA